MPVRRRRKRRAALIATGSLVLLVLLTVFTLTRSWAIIAMLGPDLGRRLGGDVSIGSAHFDWDGHVVLRDVTLFAPDVPSPAAEVLHADRIRVAVDRSSLLRLRPRIRGVEFETVRLRVSEDRGHPGWFNFQSLHPLWDASDEDEQGILAERILIDDVIVEVGEHDDTAYSLRGQRRFGGEMYLDSDDDEGWYHFQLVEQGAATPLFLKGRLNAMTLEGESRLDQLTLDERAYRMCPPSLRHWWDRMAPLGTLSGATIRWAPGSSPEAELVAQNIELTLPVSTEDFWVRYRDGTFESVASQPRLHLVSGTIRLSNDTLYLENMLGSARGTATDETVVAVPYLFNLDVRLPTVDIPANRWADYLRDAAPFNLRVRMDDLIVVRDDTGAVPGIEVPSVIAQALARFDVSTFKLDCFVELHRAEPVVDADGTWSGRTLVTSGQAVLADATAAFERFAYPLHNASSQLSFTNDELVVHYLNAQGPDPATSVGIRGRIAPLNEYPGVDLHLTARGVPLDDHLYDALPEAHRAAFEQLLNRPAFDRLDAAGLIATAAELDAARDRQREIATEIQALRRSLDAGAPGAETRATLADLERTFERLSRSVEAGPFALGGRVDIEFDIRREAGAEHHLSTTGTATTTNLGLVYAKFPYPLHLVDGTLHLLDDRVVIGDGDIANALRTGFQVRTPGGGRGAIGGTVRFMTDPDGSLRAHPDLWVGIVGDSINDVLCAALPRGPGDEDDLTPGNTLAGRLLRGIGYDGDVHYWGTVADDPSGDGTGYEFAIQFDGGRAVPHEDLAAVTERIGLVWPADLDFDSVTGFVRLRRDELLLHDVTGRRNDGTVRVNGRVDLDARPLDAEIDVALVDMALERYLIDLLPAADLDALVALWDRYDVRGRFDADARILAHDGHVGVTGLTVEPRHVDLTIDDQAIALRFSRGSLTVREREVTFNDLAMSIGHEGEAHGDLDLTGGYGLGDAGGLTLKGEWRGGRFDSPVVFEALRLGGSTDQADRFTRMAPSGAFDATFVYASAAGDRTRSFDLGVRPRTLAITLAGDRLAASLGSASLITIRPDEVIFHDVEGLLGGDQFAVEGRLSTRGTLAADLAVTYLADGLSPELRSVLPASVSDLIDALDVRTSEPIHIIARPLSITEMRDSDGVRRWRTTFTGGADVAGASFEAGLPFADVDAHLDITVVAEHGAPPQLSVQIDAASLRVSNRLMTSASARLTLLARPDVLELRDAIGMMYGGQITAEADVGVGADDAYTVRTRLAGVDLAEFAAADPAADPDSRARRAQGEMDGRLSISGLRGQPESMIGEGAVRLHRGDLGGEPLAMLMLHLVQIAPPIGGIETADVDFYISGRTAELEHIALEGPSMTLKGRGTLALDDWSIRARLDSRGRVALLSDLVAGLSGGLFSIEVTGTLADPSARLIALPGLSRPGIAATPPLVRENPDDQ